MKTSEKFLAAAGAIGIFLFVTDKSFRKTVMKAVEEYAKAHTQKNFSGRKRDCGGAIITG